jgi:hypothetical protein
MEGLHIMGCGLVPKVCLAVQFWCTLCYYPLIFSWQIFSSKTLTVARILSVSFYHLTLNLLMTTIVAPPSNTSKWQMGFNSAFKGLIQQTVLRFRSSGICCVSRLVCNVSRGTQPFETSRTIHSHFPEDLKLHHQ